MKGVVLWALGTMMAFLTTAGAFLLLANLGGGSAASGPIPQAEGSGTQDPEPALALELYEDQLEELERSPGQQLALDVENGGDEYLQSIDIELDVVSENTARPRTRSYEERVEQLPPGETATVGFEIDLSPTVEGQVDDTKTGTDSLAREILEIRATSSDGASAVKTAVLAP